MQVMLMFILSLDKNYKRDSGYSMNPTEARSSHHNLSGSQPAHGSSHSLGIKVGNLLTFVSSKKGRSLARTSPQHQHTWSTGISKMKVFWQQPVLAVIKQNWKLSNLFKLELNGKTLDTVDVHSSGPAQIQV